MPDGDEPQSDGRALVWAIGAIALAAWFTMLWLMFGDVL